jgi:DUF2946 family protein
MRQRLQALLPIVLIALMVQILAPIGVAWAAAAAASDPLAGIEICHSQADSPPPGEPHGARDHDACALCCAAAAPALDTPGATTAATPLRDEAAVVWSARIARSSVARSASNTQARAPPAA